MPDELPHADADAGARIAKTPPPAGADSFSVWIVDDDENFRTPFARLLNLEADMTCERQFSMAESLLAALKETTGPDILLLDVDLPGMSGTTALPMIKSLSPKTVVCLWSSFHTFEDETAALKQKAHAFFSKYESYEIIVATVRKEACAVKSPKRSA